MKVITVDTRNKKSAPHVSLLENNLFEDCVIKIDTFYKENKYALGWRFLSSKKALLESNPEVALITLNPGGDKIPEDHPWASCEDYNPYREETWGNSRPGQHALQIQIQRLFEKLRVAIGSDLNSKDFMDQILCGHFIPFRSPRFNDLPNKQEAIRFGYSLWSDILDTVKPRIIVCIDRETHKHLRKLIPATYGLPLSQNESIPTGWGNYMADIDSFGDTREVCLIRLPHLSTFKLFTSNKCVEPMNELFHKLM